MKRRIGIITVMMFVACGLYLYFKQSPGEKVAQEVLKGDYPNEKKVQLPSELKEFVDWYEPMVKKASPEVVAVMRRFDAKFRSMSGHRNRELEETVPATDWIQRYLDMGIEIESYDDYTDYLADRTYAYHMITNPEELAQKREWHGLPSTATLDEVIEVDIIENVGNKGTLDAAMASDPRVYGGSFGRDGTFIPSRYKTVYVEGNTIHKGRGVPDWVVYELENREIGFSPQRDIPEDVDVIYLNSKGQPVEKSTSPSNVGALETDTRRFDVPETVEQPKREQSPLRDDYDDLYPQQETSQPERKTPPRVPKNMADLEKMLTPEGIEKQLTEEMEPERFNKGQQLIDQYGVEERIPKDMNKEPPTPPE
ncbi:hypothetical protein F4X33_18820 [Candidatus Poribacteria bacterium]|nr:hypothetical protein [Candidatus Poribacteria bacterium]